MTADPAESWTNFYAYVEGDPVNNIDPDGLKTIIIGGYAPSCCVVGFFSSYFTGSQQNADWGQPGTPFNQAVSEYFGEPAEVFSWSGGVALWTILEAASSLRDYVNNFYSDPANAGKPLNIVGHSEGGNVALAFSRLVSGTINALVTLGTPIRGDVDFTSANIGTWLNLYSNRDPIQVLGGWIPIPGLGAGRTSSCAINIGVNAGSNPFTAHGNLHTADVWRQMTQWLVRAGYGLNPQNLTGQTYCRSGGAGDDRQGFGVALPEPPNQN